MDSPVAGAVAYREKDGLVLSAGLFKGLLAPGIPIHLQMSHHEFKDPSSVRMKTNKTDYEYIRGAIAARAMSIRDSWRAVASMARMTMPACFLGPQYALSLQPLRSRTADANA